ncbi:MAG: LCP family protein [Propionicimonas sp.]
MQPITEPPATKRGLVDRMAIVLLVGIVAVGVGGVTLFTLYLDRIGDTAAGLQKVEPLASYDGRPSPVAVQGVEAVNFLLMTTGGDGSLESVLVAHLSASRRNLTLIALPPDLLATDGTGTLAASYRADPLRTARAVEALTGSRMDHQLHLDADLFATVVDTIGGLELPQGRLTGAQVAGFLAGDPRLRSERTADLLRAALERASMGSALTDPGRFDKVMKALVPCLTVDSGLTTDVIRDTMMESRVQADEIVSWPLASASTPGGALPDPTSLAGLRTALAGDSFPPANTTHRAQLPSPSATR